MIVPAVADGFGREATFCPEICARLPACRKRWARLSYQPEGGNHADEPRDLLLMDAERLEDVFPGNEEWRMRE